MELIIGIILGKLLFDCSIIEKPIPKKRNKAGRSGGCIYCTSDTAPDCPYHEVDE